MSSADDYIKKLVDSAPPLTPEQRNRLAVLLRPDVAERRTRPATLSGAFAGQSGQGDYEQRQPDEVKKPATVDDILDEV